MQPLVSILTTAYNAEKFLNTYIQKLLEMDYPKVQIVFVDDGSSDNTKSVINGCITDLREKGYDLLYLYQENAGQAAALNMALKHIRGKYFTVLDVDDFLYPSCLTKRIEALEKQPELGFVISNGHNYYDTGVGAKIFSTISQKKFFEKILDGYYICNLAYTFRTSVFQKLDPDMTIAQYRAGQNIQIILPYAMHSRFVYLDEPLFGRFNAPDSHSQKVAKQSYPDRITRENEIFKIYVDTLCKSEEGLAWTAPIAVKTMFRKMNVAYFYHEKSEAKKMRKRIASLYGAMLKELLRGSLLILKINLKNRKRTDGK